MRSVKKNSSNVEDTAVMGCYEMQIAKEQVPPKPAFQEPATQENGIDGENLYT